MGDIGRRVHDKLQGDDGTVVDAKPGVRRLGGRFQWKYRIDWDEPTPCQQNAWAYVPSRFFEWADQ